MQHYKEEIGFKKKKKKYKTNVAAQDRTGDLQCVRLT
jgi:hypothetical protein